MIEGRRRRRRESDCCTYRGRGELQLAAEEFGGKIESQIGCDELGDWLIVWKERKEMCLREIYKMD